jgi:MFS family permease
MFMIGLIGFAAASLGCGIAPSVSWLIAFRTVQGAAAALLVPASLALIGSAYSGKERGRAIGTWAAAAALTTALGPVIGGWLVDAVGWRSIFFINLPLAAVAVALALKLPADRDAETGGLPDIWGPALAVLALGLLSYGLIALGEGRNLVGIIAVVAAVPAIWVFLRVEGRADKPVMPLVLFRSVSFTGVNGMTVLLYAALTGALFLLPFVLIQVAWLQRHRGRSRLPTFLNPHGTRLALVRWAGRAVRGEAAVGARSSRDGWRLRPARRVRSHHKLLDRLFAWTHHRRHWHDAERCPTYDHRLRLRAGRQEWGRVRHQQRRSKGGVKNGG